jgi:hypothetical protein
MVLTIIKEVHMAYPSLTKKELFDAVMKRIKKECFLTDTELHEVEDEIKERLLNY